MLARDLRGQWEVHSDDHELAGAVLEDLLPEDRSLRSLGNQSQRGLADYAASRGIPRAQVALAWLLRNSVVSAPIVGVGKPGHLDDAIAALEVDLTDEVVAELEAPYIPHAVAGIH